MQMYLFSVVTETKFSTWAVTSDIAGFPNQEGLGTSRMLWELPKRYGVPKRMLAVVPGEMFLLIFLLVEVASVSVFVESVQRGKL